MRHWKKRRWDVKRRGARVAEEARLESVYIVTGIEGSNPSLSANTIFVSGISVADVVRFPTLTGLTNF